MLGRALEAVAPWCMAQQYGTRVVAQVFLVSAFSSFLSLQLVYNFVQVCFRRLWAQCEFKKKNDTMARLNVLKDCIMKSAGVNAGNHSEQRITEDFYLNVFCPKAHFTLEDVLFEMPRLCNSNELVPSCLISTMPPCFIPLKSASTPALSSVQLGSGASSSSKSAKLAPPQDFQSFSCHQVSMTGNQVVKIRFRI